MPSDAPSLLRASRPSIRIDGEDAPRLTEGLLSLLIAETSDGFYRCEATFGNWGNPGGRIGFLHFDRQSLEFGKRLRIQLDNFLLFEGRISALEASFPPDRPPEITALAEDRLLDLRMTRRTRTFTDASDADVFQQIANDHGLSPDIDIPGPTHPVLAQINQSDLAFLRERARATGVELWLAENSLKAHPRPERGDSPIELAYGRQLQDFTVLADLAHQHTSLTAAGWDVAAKNALTHDAGDDALGSEISDGDSGASVLRSAFGERKGSLVHGVPLGSDEVQTLAEASFRHAARRFLTGRGIAESGNGLRVGATLDLTGLGPLFSGAYYVSEVRHRFDGRLGLRTEFRCERPWIGQP